MRAYFHRQDGLVRQVVWFAAVVTISGVVMLDALSIMNAHQTAHNTANTAAESARTEYDQSLNALAAKVAAQEYVAKAGQVMTGFSVTTSPLDATHVISVTVKGHADTYLFHYLKYIGLKKFEDKWSNPVATETSN